MAKTFSELAAEGRDPLPFDVEIKRSFAHNVRQAVELNWVGQFVQERALDQVYGGGLFSGYEDDGQFTPTWEDLKSLPIAQAREMADIRSKTEWDRTLRKFEWNNERRNSLSEQGAWGAELFAGLIDPVNFIPMTQYARGMGFLKNAKRMIPSAAAGVVPSELYRHHLDPTSTALETVTASLLGTAMASGFAAGIGRLGEHFALNSVRDFTRTVSNDSPAATANPTTAHTGYSKTQFETEYPGHSWDDFIAGKIDDGIGEAPRYQIDDGRQVYVVDDQDGIRVHVYERSEGEAGDRKIGTYQKGQIPEEALPPEHAKRVSSFDSLDAKEHVRLGARDGVVRGEVDDEGVDVRADDPEQRRAKYDAESDRRADQINEELRKLDDADADTPAAMRKLKNERQRLQRLLKNEKRLTDEAIQSGTAKVDQPVNVSRSAHKWLHDRLEQAYSRIGEKAKKPLMLREAVDWMIASSQDAALVALLRRVYPVLRDGQIDIVKPGKGIKAGSYRPVSDDITIAFESTGVPFDDIPSATFQRREEILTHEVLHMATSLKLHQLELRNGAEWKEISALLERVRDRFGDIYAAKNAHELFSVGLTSPKFRGDLARMPWSPTKNAWQKFVSLLKKIWGIDDDNELTHLLDLFDRVAIRDKNVQELAFGAGATTRPPGMIDEAAPSPAALIKAKRAEIESRLTSIADELKGLRKTQKETEAERIALRTLLNEKKQEIHAWQEDIEEAGLSAEDFAVAPVMGGFERKLGAIDMPWYRLNGTKLRELAPELATDWIILGRKLAGSPDLLQGSAEAGTGASVEGMAKGWTGAMMDAIDQLSSEYNKMLGGSGETSSFGVYARDKARGAASMLRGAKEKVTGRAHDTKIDEEPMRLGEFYDAVGEEMITGTSKDPHIKKSAAIMADFYKKMGDELEAMGATNTKAGMEARIKKVETRITNLKDTLDTLKSERAQDYARELIKANKDELGALKVISKRMEDPRLFKSDESFFHRVWDRDAVESKKDLLREILAKHYKEHPYIRQGGKIIQLKTDDASIEKRVDSTIRTILDEIDEGDTLGIVKKNEAAAPHGKDEGRAGLPSELIGRKLDIPNSLVSEFIVKDVRVITDIYTQRVAPQIEMIRQFGDNSMRAYLEDLKLKAIESDASPAAVREIQELEKSAQNLRDVVLGNYYTGPDPSSMTSRVSRGLMQFNMITSMGKVFYVALNDVGKGVMAFGLQRSMGGLFRYLADGSKGEFRVGAKQVRQAGEAVDLANNQRAYEIFGAQGDMIGRTKLERGINNLTGTTFIANLMSPWTDVIKGTFGAMMQSRMIEDAINWSSLSAKRKAEIGRIGFTEEFASKVSAAYKAAGNDHGETLLFASTGKWEDPDLVRQFRGMLADEVNRLVMTPNAATQPLFVHNDWVRPVIQYKKFGMTATQNLLMAGLQRKEMSFISTIAAMVGISFIVDMRKSPEYIELPFADRLYRAVEISGVTGILLDANSMLEGATGGEWGARAMMGLKNFERNPTAASRTGALLGPVVNQWGALTQAIVDPTQDTADMARAIRYTIPWNNMLWWNDMTNRLQRTSVNMIEDFEE